MSPQSDKYSDKLHKGTKASIHERARELRHKSTEAEQKLWLFLRNRQLKGKKFRRQHAIADYVLDFYCHECRLGIELDGNYHNDEEAKELDAARTKLLNEFSVKVLRFWNSDVMTKTEKVVEAIEQNLY